MSVQTIDPDSKLDWQHDWTSWLAAGDNISSRQWTVTPTGPTLANDTSEVVKISGCTAGKVYKLTEHITTSQGLEADRTITIRCINR